MRPCLLLCRSLAPLLVALAAAAPAAAQIPALDFHEIVVPDAMVTSCAFPQAGDLNGDGLEDIYWIESPFSSRALAGDGLGGFTLLGGGVLPGAPFAYHATDGDMNGDGLDDLVAIDIGQGTFVYRSLGTGSFALTDSESTPDDPNWTMTADLDRDGDLDVATVWGDFLFSAGLRVWRNDGTGALTQSDDDTSGPWGRLTRVEAADIDGDGTQDLVVSADKANFDGAVLFFRGIGQARFAPAVELHTVDDIGYVARVADLDNDGWPDIATSRIEGDPQQYVLESLINEGGGVFGDPVPGGVGRVEVVRDFNGDGIADAIVVPVGPTGSFADTLLARGVGDGSFLPGELVESTLSTGMPGAAGRLDQNLSWDLFDGDFATKDVHVLLNDQAGCPFETASPPIAGVAGEPRLWGTGSTLAGQTIGVSLTGAKPSAPLTLVLGTTLSLAKFKGGLLGPAPILIVSGLFTSGAGELNLSGTWPGGIPLGAEIYLQAWIGDPAAVQGFAASNTLRITAD